MTATLTWSSDSATDTAPPKVWITETADAGWVVQGGYTAGVAGGRSVTIGGTVTNNDYDMGSWSDKHGYTFHQDIHEITGGSTIVRTCTIKANCSTPGTPYPPNDDVPPPYSSELSVAGGFSVGIIATPYDFKGTRTDNPTDPRTFIWNYTWKSTTGDKANLADVLIYEHIEYPGGNATTAYTPPTPFTGYAIPHNPGDIHMFPGDVSTFHGWGDAESLTDGHADMIRSITQVGSNPPNYTGTFTVNQEYRWYLPYIHDVVTASGVDTTGFSVLKGSYGPMHPIVRTVLKEPAGNYYQYTITKHGETLTWYFDPANL